EQPLHGAIGSFDFGEVVSVPQAVNVDQIDMVGLQALQAARESSHKIVAGAVRDLGSEPDLLAARHHYFPHARLALLVPLSIGRIQVVYSQVDRAIKRGQRLLFLFIHQEAAATAEGQDGDTGASATQSTMGKTLRSAVGGDTLQNGKRRSSR